MPSAPCILHLNTRPAQRIPQMTLAGIRRYAAARGWMAEAFSEDESRPEAIPALLASRAPVVGCVYDCSNDSVPTMEVFGDDVSKYGNIGIGKEENGVMQVSAIVEKPSVAEALSNNAIIGRYVLAGGIMGKLKALKPRNNEIYLTDVLDELAAKGELLATVFEGTRYDVGDKAGFIKANIEYALRSEEIGEEVKEYLKEKGASLK